MKITAANAAQLAAKSQEARKRNKELRIAEEIARKEAILRETLAPADESYDARRLARVRAQLNSVDTAIEAIVSSGEDDKRRLRDLMDAQSRLAEQVRILAGKPLPGSYKPTGKPSRRQAPSDISPDLQS